MHYSHEQLLKLFQSSQAIKMRPANNMLQIHMYPDKEGYATISLKNSPYLTADVIINLQKMGIEVNTSSGFGITRVSGQVKRILNCLLGNDHCIKSILGSVFYYIERANGVNIPISVGYFFTKECTVDVPALDDTVKQIMVEENTLLISEAGLYTFTRLSNADEITQLQIMTLTREMIQTLVAQKLTLAEALKACPNACKEDEVSYTPSMIFKETIPCDKNGVPLISPDPFTHECRKLKAVERVLLATDRHLYNAQAIIGSLRLVRHLRELDREYTEAQTPMVNTTMEKLQSIVV